MGIKMIRLVFISACILFLSACQAVETSQSSQSELQLPDGNQYSEMRPQNVKVTSQVVTQDGYPVGIRLSDSLTLYFRSPSAKLYTDPLFYQMAVQEGLNGFLITVIRPGWLESCGELLESQPTRCQFLNREVFIQQFEISDTSVWLSVPVDHVGAESEIQEIGLTLRLEK